MIHTMDELYKMCKLQNAGMFVKTNYLIF